MNRNCARVTPYYILYSVEDEDYLEFFDTKGELFYRAAYMYAFDDCEPRIVKAIMAEGDWISYAGWKPGMRFDFINDVTGEVVWSECHESWDH